MHPGGPASRVVEAMGEAFGVEANADPSMKRDYFTLALHDETFESARALIARALFAEWIEREGKW